MKLVIDIAEEVYQHYKKIWQKRRGSVPESCIAIGTPLPKVKEGGCSETIVNCKCSECGTEYYLLYPSKFINYCPHCGLNMKEEMTGWSNSD